MRQGMVRRRRRVEDINRCFSRKNHVPKKLLDIGFGNAAIAEFFIRKGVEVSGIEVNENQVKMARERIPNGQFLLYNGTKIPFDDSSFDSIILNDILEHISYEDIEILLPEIKRVLKPGGFIYISVMNRWQLIEPHKLIPFLTWLPKKAWHPICKTLRGQDYIYYWPYTRKRAQNLFIRHGLLYQDMTDIYVLNKFTGINPIGNRTTSKIFSLMRRFHLSSMAYALALKISVLLYLVWKPE
ncbi:MAG: class I SAM-dependent methyltransferase [Candidatus Hodarchaeota archaeon]